MLPTIKSQFLEYYLLIRAVLFALVLTIFCKVFLGVEEAPVFDTMPNEVLHHATAETDLKGDRG
ncbi:hypothetical protein [Litoribacillus peritrichatus]|uniref:hypothetical protein n=1 Tax=Litoribacillus peritrichatus TaxID=718191 RepID=UPI0031D9E89D